MRLAGEIAVKRTSLHTGLQKRCPKKCEGVNGRTDHMRPGDHFGQKRLVETISDDKR